MRLVRTGALAAIFFGCGGKSSADLLDSRDASAEAGPPALDASQGGLDVALTIPIGSYADCEASTVSVTAHEVATGGGKGTVTLSVNGEGAVSAALSFAPFLSGTVAFAPTTGTTAASTAGPFHVDTLDQNTASVTVPVVASSLALVGDTLFISVEGLSGDARYSGYCRCPVAASLPTTTVVNRVPATGSIPTGTYRSCTTSLAGHDTSDLTGGDLSLTLTESNGTLAVTESSGYPSVCGFSFQDDSGSTATLSGGQTCTIQAPCGPPPSLGPSSAPNQAALTNMTGSIQLVQGALFVNVVGDAPPDACGRHTISLICPNGP